MSYRIYDISDKLPEADEPLGSKRKFWLTYDDGQRWLFKYTRVNQGIYTGEDWSEKIAAELGRLMGVPTAHVELATCRGERGVAIFDFLRITLADSSQWLPVGQLVHGNELLAERVDPNYPVTATRGVSAHTVDRCLAALGLVVGHVVPLTPGSPSFQPPKFASGADMFVGYLLLDAWIGNTDRHHENWGAIDMLPGRRSRQLLVLAPSYDHASSLGRNVDEGEFAERLTTRDENRTVAAYVTKARSALFANVNDRKPLSPIEAFRMAARIRARAAETWLERLAQVQPAAWRSVIEQVPSDLMSDNARAFVDRILAESRQRLLCIKDDAQ